MEISVAKEIKPQEGRVGLMPREVRGLVEGGHGVLVETGAGVLSGAGDDDYISAGAEIVAGPAEAYGAGDMVVKVKEILPEEFRYLDARHILFTNLHSALNRELTDKMLDVGLSAISAENTHEKGSPNCPLAGEIGALEGVRLCLAPHGGSGRHFMPHFGAPALKAVVIGLGMVGQGALRTLIGLSVSVVGLDIQERARFHTQLQYSGADFEADDISALPGHLADADLIVNCVMWPKHRDDHLIDRNMLKTMKPTAVIADISCDTAGAIETTRPTTWADPVYVADGIRHLCIDNLPGAAPVTASAGYSEAILPWVKLIAYAGVMAACRKEAWLARGLTCRNGVLILEETGHLQDRAFTPLEDYLAGE
jgi:alanine dehydrogenase